MQKFFLLSILIAAVACGKSDSSDSDDACSSGCSTASAPAGCSDGCGDASGCSDDASGCGGGDVLAKAGQEVVLNVTGMT